MKIIFGDDCDRKNILKKHPHTSQVLGEGGNLIVAKNEYDEIIGFLWSFRRHIPTPIDNLTEDFINVIEVFNDDDKNKGIGSLLVEKSIEKAKEDELFQIRAYCDINNVPSIRLWAKNNFGISPIKMSDGSICGAYVTFVIN